MRTNKSGGWESRFPPPLSPLLLSPPSLPLPSPQLWDTAGQERYRSLAPMYYRGASAAVVVFDVTNRESFEGAKSWVKELQRRGDQNVVIALAGNKADMKEKRLVDVEEAKEYAKENGLIYMDTSAKSNLNVKEIFAAIGEREGRKDAAVRSFHHAAVGEQRAATRRTDSFPARPRCRTTRSSPQPPHPLSSTTRFPSFPNPSRHPQHGSCRGTSGKRTRR
jgi:hypothetical protein